MLTGGAFLCHLANGGGGILVTVTERFQGSDGIGAGIVRLGQRRLPRQGHWTTINLVEPITHFDDQSFGGFLANARHFHQRGGVLIVNALRQPVCLDAGENGQGHFRADAVDLDQRPKQLALIAISKAIQQLGVLTHHEMGVQGERLTGLRQAVKNGHGGFHFIAHPVHIQQQHWRAFLEQGSAQLSYHGCVLLSFLAYSSVSDCGGSTHPGQ